MLHPRFWALLVPILALSTPALVSASLVSEIIQALEGAIDCTGCHLLMVPLQLLAKLGDTIFVDTIVAVCQTLKLEDDDVCQGAVSEQGPIIAQDLRQISTTGSASTLLCASVFGLCQQPAINPYTVPFPSPAPSNPKAWLSSGQAPFQVIHFSDVHIDRQYTPGAEANCTKPICCRNFADETGTPTEPAGPNGNHHCDSPVALADSMLEFAQEIGSAAKFSIFTGDVVEGAVWLVNQSEMTSKLGAVVFPSVGPTQFTTDADNSDSAPVNAFPRNTSTAFSEFQWIYDVQSADWQYYLYQYDAALQAEVRLLIFQRLTLLRPDPNGILAFLVQELQATEDADQRAWILGHIPFGSGDYLHDQSNYYDQILQRYKNSIAGHFFGHTHKVSMRNLSFIVSEAH
ncbi:hypothetical protein HWV62_35336 [Athelia sp. TMB]|nr:hypothetical protein HWV62_35336 [Athelia sp. TMB]